MKFAEVAPQSTIHYLSEDEKHHYIDESLPFLITDVVKDDGKFGERWVVTIETEGEEGQQAISLSTSPSRDRDMQKIMQALDGNPDEAIGPVFLSQTVTKAGRPFYVFLDVENAE